MQTEVIEGGKFFISYNPCPGGGIGMFGSDTGGPETALVIRGGGGNKSSGNSYLILNGDFREDYRKLVKKGLKACKAFYEKKKKKHGSSWSQE